MSIKLVSVNIERDKHLDRVIPFIKREKPDVLCVQEIYEKDIPLFKHVMPGSHRFSPAARYREGENSHIVGEAIFSSLPVKTWFAHKYAGPSHITDSDLKTYRNHIRTLMGCEIRRGSGLFRIGATHFTWTPDGQPDNHQRHDVRNLLDAALSLGQLILCGDFNAPRDGEIFSFIADHYTDAIPRHYKTSIDISLHIAGRERSHEFGDKMVDGLFISGGYRASDVRLVKGLSDHCAVVGELSIAGRRRIFNILDALHW